MDETVLARSLQQQMFLKTYLSLSGYIYKTIPLPCLDSGMVMKEETKRL